MKDMTVVMKEEFFECIMDFVQAKYRTFGGGVGGNGFNPISDALKDNPLMFDGGVDVASVVKDILFIANIDVEK